MSSASEWMNRKKAADAEWRRLQHIDSRRSPSKVIADPEIRAEELGMRLLVMDGPGPVWLSADEALALANWILATFGSGPRMTAQCANSTHCYGCREASQLASSLAAAQKNAREGWAAANAAVDRAIAAESRCAAAEQEIARLKAGR